MIAYTRKQIKEKFENTERLISDLPNQTYKKAGEESVSRVIIGIIQEEFRSSITNVAVLWDTGDDGQKTEDEFYPKPFDTKTLFKNNITRMKKVYPISGKEAFFEYGDYLNRDILVWDSLCTLPIKHNKRKGTIILLSYKKGNMPLSKKQINSLQKTINKTLELYDAYSFIAQLSDVTYKDRPDKTLSNKYDLLSMALRNHKDNIRHFSIWKIDDISKNDFVVIRNKSQNFGNLENNGRKTFLLKNSRKEDKNHNVIKYINWIKKGIREDAKKEEKINLIKYIKHDKVTKEDIKDIEEYCDSLKIEVKKTEVIYIPIIPLRLKGRTDRINILCLYINNREQSIFRNLTMLSQLSRKVYESLMLHNQLIRNDTIKEVLRLHDEKHEKDFYLEVADLLIKKNQCSACYIYMKENPDYLRMIVGKKENGDTIGEKEGEKISASIPMVDRKITLLLESKISDDVEFREFLTTTISTLEVSPKEKKYYLYYGTYPLGSNTIYSAILLPIIKEKQKNEVDEKKKKEEFVGFVLFTNKEVFPGDSDEKYSPYFSTHNESVVSPSIESIYRYKLLQDSIKNKDVLLGKIRHEIPHEVNLIKKQVTEITDYFEEQYEKVNSMSEKEYFRGLLSKVHQLALSNTRIELMASFATSANLTEKDILKKRKNLNFKTYINAVKDIFREEAKEKGVGIIFREPSRDHRIGYVSRFYELAVHNIIFNAIRYSRFGTCVEVIMEPGMIKVVNYGIGIKEEEKDKIYEENYRGNEAKNFTKDGLGFGLFLAKKVIHAHDGHFLRCESEKQHQHNYEGIRFFRNSLGDNELQTLNRYINDKDRNVSRKEYSNFEIETNRLLRQFDFNHDFERRHDSRRERNVAYFVKSEFSPEYNRRITFNAFRKLFLDCDVYKTTFTIKFP